jgi:transcriptional regulator with XRE-family HTH domain
MNAVVQLTDEQFRAVDTYLLVEAVAQIIRERRVAAGISARELGRRSGLARDIVGLMERRPGKQGGYVATMVSIAEALGMRGSELLALAEKRVAQANKENV